MNPIAALWLEEGFELIWRKYGRVYQSFDGIRHFSISLMNLESGSSEFPKDYRRPGQFISIKEDRLWESTERHANHIQFCPSCWEPRRWWVWQSSGAHSSPVRQRNWTGRLVLHRVCQRQSELLSPDRESR